MEWVKCLRLPIVILAGLLTLVSFKLTGLINQSLLPIFTVIAATAATVVLNDWHDRIHDTKKGKTLAFQHPIKFLILTILLWAITVVLTFLVLHQNNRLVIVPVFGILVGLLYSETRKIPFLPITLVSIASASCALFPVFIVDDSSHLWFLFVVTGITIFSREIMKDLDDLGIDSNYKRTPPVILGASKARIVAGIMLIGLVGLLIQTHLLNYFVGIPFFAVSMFFLLVKKNHKVAKRFLDAGITMVLISLLF